MKKLALVLVVLAMLIVPLTASGAGVTYTSGFQLQNLSASPAAVLIDFYDQQGNQPANSSVTDTIPANGQKVYYPLGTLQPGFNGSAVVSSDQSLAAITNVLGNDAQRGDSYAGFVSGATTMNLPLVMKANYNNNTWFNVQNTSSSDATVVVHYAGSAPSNPNVSCDEPAATIKPYASKTYDQSTNTCLPDKFVGAATVTSTNNQPVAVVVMEVGQYNLLSYTGFANADAAAKPVMPLIMSKNYNNFTSISIMNTGATATAVTVSYTPLPNNGAACTETQTVQPGKMGTFGYPTMPAACGTGAWLGSASVTTNSASMPLVAIVNQVNSANANASAYNAFNPSKATKQVSMPLIMDRNYGLYTSVSVVNMGAQNTNVTCTFTNTPYQMTATNLAPGASASAIQRDQIGDKYVGAGTCTASGGDALIAVTVNQVKPSVATDDKLFTYPGFNY